MNVLVIAAHMDDETLGVGGTIARHAAAGDAVTVCIVCNRAYGHQVDAKIQREEKAASQQAASALGYQQLRFLDLPDERVGERLMDAIVPIEACVREVQPAVVYTHHRGDSNQDHRAVFQASMIACRTVAQPKVPKVLCYEVLSSTDQAPPFLEYAFQPNYYVNIAETVHQKLKAMEAYRRELREFPHPRSLRGIEVLAQRRGMDAGFRAAEAFVIVRDEWA